MPSHRTLFTLCLLSLLALILPQCSDKNSGDYYKEGLAQVEAQDYDGAEAAFQKAIEKNPKNPNGYYGLGEQGSGTGSFVGRARFGRSGTADGEQDRQQQNTRFVHRVFFSSFRKCSIFFFKRR